MKIRHLFINKSIFLLLIIYLFFSTVSFAMSETEQERLGVARQTPILDLYDPRGHHGAADNGATFHDEIVFFNVGQGHAALINKIGHVPLLVDAGSSSVPYAHHEQYVWENEKRELFASKISTKILSFWKASNDNVLEGGNYRLNILITHGDDDHLSLIPLILNGLEEKEVESSFTFVPTLLLGGEQRHYEKRDKRKKEPNFLALLKPSYTREFSSNRLGMFHQGNLGFLDSSGCVTHLYCPRGTGRAKDENTWSVVTRVQINGISAMITGDADATIKDNMLRLLGREESLESDILLLPHHGAEGIFHEHWDGQVNPRAIIVGSAPHGGLIEKPERGYRHPRGETFLNSLRLLQDRGRIWNRVSPHAIGYFCSEDLNAHIQGAFRGHEGYLFEPVPNRALADLEQPPHSRWYLVWTDSPLYTLWTTGSLLFSRDVVTPQFVDAPNGLMTYIAVPEPKYYFSPSQRAENIVLTELIGYFSQGGEGSPETLIDVISSVPLERRHNTEREGFLLTSNLTVNENRAKILRALWDIPLEQREEILSQFKAITKDAIGDPKAKDHSAMYRILQSLVRIENREAYVAFLNEKSLLPSDDMLSTATTLEVFSQLSLQEARETIEFFEPIYQNFSGISHRERINLLNMITALANIRPAQRQNTFNYTLPLLMPFERNEDSRNNFRDVSDNANLITIFSSLSADTIEEFSQQLGEAWTHLTAHGPQDLYGENKHFFIRGMLQIPDSERCTFLKSILPLLSHISQKKFESWVAAAITQKLAKIYSEPHFSIRLEYLNKQETQRTSKETSVFHPESINLWLERSASYAERQAQSLQ